MAYCRVVGKGTPLSIGRQDVYRSRSGIASAGEDYHPSLTRGGGLWGEHRSWSASPQRMCRSVHHRYRDQSASAVSSGSSIWRATMPNSTSGSSTGSTGRPVTGSWSTGGWDAKLQEHEKYSIEDIFKGIDTVEQGISRFRRSKGRSAPLSKLPPSPNTPLANLSVIYVLYHL